MGPGASVFLQFLERSLQSYWQMLPVGPTGYGDSPYSSESTFAGEPLLIALEPLVESGLLRGSVAQRAARPSAHAVSFDEVRAARQACLRAAFATFQQQPGRRTGLERFRSEEAAWLEDFVLFRAIKERHGGRAWTTWPIELRARERTALDDARATLADEMAFHAFVQYVFSQQWRSLRERANSHGVGLIGDVPIFVAHDSADVWAHPELFKLDDAGMPRVVAGVPPDYFSASGQRWGNPLYEWQVHEASGFAWWIHRLKAALARFDVVRLDHFIGFHRAWEIPAACPTAVEGVWRRGPGEALFSALEEEVGGGRGRGLPLLAEDLGCTTSGVTALRDRFKLPGTKVLQFAFGNDPSAHDFLPHNYPRRSVVYTGTHDNDTIRGWFDRPTGGSDGASPDDEKQRQLAREYLAIRDDAEVHWAFIRAALASVAMTAIVPLQDALGLGSEARMNRPGTTGGNWRWRATAAHLSPALEERLSLLTHTYGRDHDKTRA
jgi:4-alpha-glucanotransferase